MPLGAPSGVPWGVNLSGHPSALSAKFYCFVCILRAWEGGSWVSLLSQAWFFTPLSFWGQGPQSVSRTQLKGSQPFQTQGYLNTGGFPLPQGRGQQARGDS